MSFEIEIQKKPKVENTLENKITSPKSVYQLKEVQEIKDAIQEHLLFIGLDRGNNIRNIRIIGIGTSGHVNIDSKDIVRSALLTFSDKVILVHNHPSNNLNPSNSDKHITNFTNQLLKIFNIELVDHIIVTDRSYSSMKEKHFIKNEYENYQIDLLNKVTLFEENKTLKNKIKKLENRTKEKSNELEI